MEEDADDSKHVTCLREKWQFSQTGSHSSRKNGNCEDAEQGFHKSFSFWKREECSTWLKDPSLPAMKGMQGEEPQTTRKPQCLCIIKSPKFKTSIWENNPKTKQQNHTRFLKETTKSIGKDYDTPLLVLVNTATFNWNTKLNSQKFGVFSNFFFLFESLTSDHF